MSTGTGLFRSALVAAVACLSVAHAQNAASLTSRHSSLRDRLAVNQFQRPLVLESSQGTDGLKGDIYALIDQPYKLVGPALRGADRWCDILILHLNVKRCSAAGSIPGQAGNDKLSLNIGRKFDQPPEEAYRFEFLYKVLAAQPDYLQVVLDADEVRWARATIA